jgi:hypothetical protein
MDKPVHTAHEDGAASSASVDRRIASLRNAGAHRFDPLGQHYLEALSKRAKTHQGLARQQIDQTLLQALNLLAERFELAQAELSVSLDDTVVTYPHATEQLQRLFSDSDFNGLKQCIRDLKKDHQPSPLGVLLRQFEQHAPDRLVALPVKLSGLRPELKTVRSSRNTWSKMSASRHLTRALEQAPKNAGPINSHMLVLRSLALMRTISPDYLNRFMSYADTLLSLDQAEKDKPANTKKSPSVKLLKK